MHTYFDIECTAGLLETEVVVKLGIGQIAAFQRNVIASVFQAVCER